MKFELRRYDFEAAIEEFHVNERTLKLAQIQAANLLMNESGFSSTDEFSSSTQLSSSQEKLSRFAAGYSELDRLEEETDLLDHLNMNQQEEIDGKPNESGQLANAEVQEIANALKFLADRFARAVLWFDSKDARESHNFKPKDLVEEFHQAKFIDRSIVNIHKPAT